MINDTKTFNGGRLRNIDALRGIAALGVVFYHVILQAEKAVPNNAFKWPIKTIQFASSFGYIGVFLFFVISGFCIHLQWTRSKVQQTEKPIEFGTFWRRRIRRLYPPYLIAFALFMLMAALTTGIKVTPFFIYDVVMHLLMLHNLDPQTAYSINGVFWTLAVEEQLYLAYFLLLFMRRRWGWRTTLLLCAATRVGWFFFSHAVWIVAKQGVPVPEAAASHWFTWALGAIAVEAAFGLVTLPPWCKSLSLGAIAIVAASAISTVLPNTPKDTFTHDFAWLVMHPLWGFGFFVVVNRAVAAEQMWVSAAGILKRMAARTVAAAAAVGVFSYSLYLTHELVIMQSWSFTIKELSPFINAMAVVVPATIGFAWLFFRYCERPYMRKVSGAASQPVKLPEPREEQTLTTFVTVTDEA